MKVKMPARRAANAARLIDLLDDAFALLRSLPVAAWSWLLCGSVPFVLVFLYFWTDMSRAPDAARRLVDGALWVALAFVSMKICHAWFGEHMLARLRGERGVRPLRVSAWVRLAASQALLHSIMPVALLLASLAALPFAWVYAFFHNASILAVGHFREGGTCGGLVSRAVEAARHAPLQNHGMLAACSVAGLLLWFNLLVLAMILPMLANSFSGLNNAVADNPLAMFNTTVLAAITAITWLGMTPFFRAAYAVRCFATLSRRDGEDVLVELRRWRKAASGSAVASLNDRRTYPETGAADETTSASGALPAAANRRYRLSGGVLPFLLAASVFIPSATRADDTISDPPMVEPAALEQSIREVMASPVYQWRLPREATPESEMGFIERTVRDFAEWTRDTVVSLAMWIDRIIERLLRRSLDIGPGGGAGDAGLAAVARPLFILIAVVIVLVAAALLLRAWLRARKLPRPAVVSSAPMPDLEDENLIASDLAEDQWLALARERFAAGDTRQALRALFLGTLAGLGERGMLAIARGKTNGMYARELARRASHLDEVRAAFTENTRVFDGVWYGTHEVDESAWQKFQENHSTIASHVRTS